MKNTFWIYILLCNNDHYYTGYTIDLDRRYQEHLDGTAKCKYTRSFKPLCIAASWKVIGEKSIALKIESFIKKMPKKDKHELVQNPNKFNMILRELLDVTCQNCDLFFSTLMAINGTANILV